MTSTVRLILWIIIISFWVVFLFLKLKPEKTYSVILMDNSEMSDHFYIPVTIDDREYKFLFDTGASHNVIDSALAQNIGLKKSDGTVFLEIKRFFETRADSIDYVIKNFSFENLKTTGIFLLNGYKGFFLEDTLLMKKVGAIMGMETIKNFNWLFNFPESSVNISKGKIKIPALKDDQILTVEYHDSVLTPLRVNLTIEGIKIQNILFDTGFGRSSIQSFGKYKQIDIFFSQSDFEVLTANDKKEKIIFPSEMGDLYIIDSMQINDFTMQGMLVIVHNNYDETYVTASFFRRFRMMYFDSMNKKIQLYVSPSDSARHHRRDLQNFRRALLQHSEDNQGKNTEEASQLPASIIDLW